MIIANKIHPNRRDQPLELCANPTQDKSEQD